MVRLSLYNRGRSCGAHAILKELAELHVRPLPSLSTIKRILTRRGLTHGRTGHYL
jgi:putative transposase